MLYLDYTWDLEPNHILLDKELETEKLGWKDGDCFRFSTSSGCPKFEKLDPVVVFAMGHKVHKDEESI
jgi:hypothetical protein